VCLHECRRKKYNRQQQTQSGEGNGCNFARLKMTFDGQTYATKERATEIDIGGADNEAVMDESG
jgi:hypothetical protein